MLKRVFTKVDFPRPDSPEHVRAKANRMEKTGHTNNHNVEVEALADAFAMPLIGQVGKSDIACELSSNDIPHIAGSLGCSFGISRGNSLSCPPTHRIAFFHVW